MQTGFIIEDGQRGSMDKRNVATHSATYFVATLAEVFTVGRDVPVSGLVLGERQWSEAETKGYLVTVNYEGVPDGLSETEESFEFAPSFGEEPLPAHPDWPKIKEFYKGSVDKDGKVTFAEFLTPQSGGGLGGASAERQKNPLFGAKTYLALKAVFRWTYVRRTLPNDILSRIASIRKGLPGGLPTPPDHDWLVMPPKVVRKGDVYEISEDWMMSQKGGWPTHVHKLVQT
jgi:hypothetical protein